VKKLLIIQQDEAYFLFETLQVLEKNNASLKDFELTLLVNEKALKAVYKDTHPLVTGITTAAATVASQHFDMSVNLSLNEASWDFHGEISSDKKLGALRISGQIFVEDLWSSYLMTLKGKAPFLTFHLQDVYKNILGFKNFAPSKKSKHNVRQIAIGSTSTKLFSAVEQESLIYELSLSYPNYPLKDLAEVDLFSDVSSTLYIGPASLEALKFCEAGGKGIFLTSAFQGFNLLPHHGEHIVVSSRGAPFKASYLLTFIEREISGQSNQDSQYSIYKIETENIFGSYLKSLNPSDDNYPFYQSHLVLWNFLLNLYDSSLDIIKCNDSQLELLKTHEQVLQKFIRLHDYAMVSIDTIYHESKAKLSDVNKVEGHLKNLLEIETVADQIAQSHSLLRPVLDFYRIRRGQNNHDTLLEQSQASFLVYSEEHQALQALNELFSVTLKRNDVSI
jgi:hypothetical protein